MRADAARNRQRVLQAADAVFAEQGVTVGIDEVAQRAGVGVGTVYRHFPTKEALYEAIVVSHLEGLVAEARRLGEGGDAGESFFGFLARVVGEATAKRDLTDALAGAGVDVKALVAVHFTHLSQAAGVLLARAQQAGVIRGDVTIDDVLTLVGGTCMAAGSGAPGLAERLLSFVCDGLRAGRLPLGGEAPSS